MKGRLGVRWLAVALAAVLALTTGGTVAYAVSPNDFAMVTNDTYVNLRSGPSTDYGIIGSYTNGTWLTVFSESGNWYYVTGPDGKTGYVSKTFAEKGPLEPATVAVVNNPNPSSFLNFRTGPSYDAKVIDILYNGVPAYVHGKEGAWYKVSINGVDGYLQGNFVKIESMLATTDIYTIVTPNNTGLNLRQGPGKDYSVIKQFRGGNYVMVLMKGTAWSKVSINGYVGYMDNSFLRQGIIKPTGGGSGGGTTPPVSSGKGYGIVNNPISTQLLNMRETPSTAAKVLGRYKNGTRVTVLSHGTQWCKVQVDKTGAVGFMMTQYLRLYDLPATATATVNHPMHTFVNLRKTASMNASVLMRITHGRTVTVLVPGDDWVKVSYNGTTGYMVSYFLTLNN